MASKESLVGLFDMDESHVKGILERPVQEILLDFPAGLASKAQAMDFFPKGDLAVFAGGVKLKGFSHERCSCRVNCFGLGSALIEITQGSRHWIETLLEPAVKAFLDLFPKVPAVVCRNHCLDISR